MEKGVHTPELAPENVQYATGGLVSLDRGMWYVPLGIKNFLSNEDTQELASGYLHFVFEKGGTEEHTGKPVAFIECAWRRYTKHSRNKAQEIQGAIMPLFEKYKKDNPFIGVILAGVFTDNSLKQLQSLGFTILYFPYELIVNAFRVMGVDVYFEENTTEEYFAKQVSLWEKLNDAQKNSIYKKITEQNLYAINQFMSSLQLKLDRRITKVFILMMYGKQWTCPETRLVSGQVSQNLRISARNP